MPWPGVSRTCRFTMGKRATRWDAREARGGCPRRATEGEGGSAVLWVHQTSGVLPRAASASYPVVTTSTGLAAATVAKGESAVGQPTYALRAGDLGYNGDKRMMDVLGASLMVSLMMNPTTPNVAK